MRPMVRLVIEVLLAEDQAMVRGALVSLLSLEPDIEVVCEAADGVEALDRALELCPQVAVLDIEMPGLTGLQVAAELAQRLPSCKVLIVTTFGKPGYMRRAIEGGAVGFLLKDSPATELAHAIRRAARGEQVIAPALAAEAIREGVSPLTAREHEVLLASRDARSVAELAGTLHLSHGTTRNHLSTIMQKVGAVSRAEALRIAEEKGWL